MIFDNPSSPAELLASWAQVFRPTAPVGASWNAVREIVGAASTDGRHRESELVELLNRSDKALPCGDPLRAELGLHRWLAADREEAYSDWFQWILQQLDADEIAALLRIRPDIAQNCRSLQPSIEREWLIPGGRLDLALFYGRAALVVMEIKTASADDSQTDTAKNARYRDWANAQHLEYRPQLILISVDAAEDDYHGFAPVTWKEVCIGLRKILMRPAHRANTPKAAMITALIGAVETNLLHLSAPDTKGPGNPLFYVRTAEHIESCLSTTEV